MFLARSKETGCILPIDSSGKHVVGNIEPGNGFKYLITELFPLDWDHMMDVFPGSLKLAPVTPRRHNCEVQAFVFLKRRLGSWRPCQTVRVVLVGSQLGSVWKRF